MMIVIRTGIFFFILAAMPAAPCVHPLTAQQAAADPSVIRLVRHAAQETALRCSATDIWLQVSLHPLTGTVEQIFAEALIGRSRSVFREPRGSGQKVSVDIRGTAADSLSIQQGNAAAMQLGVTIESNAEKMITWSRTFDAGMVPIADSDTRMSPESGTPPDGFFEQISEPVLVTLAAIVVVVLFFTVRGS